MSTTKADSAEVAKNLSCGNWIESSAAAQTSDVFNASSGHAIAKVPLR